CHILFVKYTFFLELISPAPLKGAGGMSYRDLGTPQTYKSFKKKQKLLPNMSNPPTPDFNKNTTPNKPVIIAKKLKRKESATEKSWEEYVLKLQQSAPEHLENAAKFLGALVSVCFTLLARTHHDIFVKIGEHKSVDYLEIAPLLLWLFCIAFCFFVFFPFDYYYSKDAAETIEQAHQDIITNKRSYLKVATVLFLLGAVALLVGVVV
ncbi:MAG: hypothetical protein ACPGVB_09780, partial [Chitinophagales bacterium]